jgi:diacylglycerol kinase (ATP)
MAQALKKTPVKKGRSKAAYQYSHIGIIYNPNSSGKAPEKAQKLRKQLQKRLPDTPLTLRATEYAGHAEELAYELAGESHNPLIISVSGDGGYHEVINGALRAEQAYKTKPVCAVYGAGNANDHHHALRKKPLVDAIVEDTAHKIDLLQIEITNKAGLTGSRFAHSYAGLGITPLVAAELNRQRLNQWRELVLVATTFWRYKPFTIKIHNKPRQFDSLVFANINRMAKVVKLSKNGKPDDGQFELIEVPHNKKMGLVVTAARAAVFGLGPQPRRRNFLFTAVEDIPMQLDGEVKELKKGDRVHVRIAPRQLRTLL